MAHDRVRFAMRCTPSDSTAVTTAGRPSGTAATASATPRMSTSKIAGKPRTSSTTMIVTIITTAMTTTIDAQQLADAIELLLQRRGLLRRLFSMPAMRPISVCMPVAVTTARPRP